MCWNQRKIAILLDKRQHHPQSNVTATSEAATYFRGDGISCQILSRYVWYSWTILHIAKLSVKCEDNTVFTNAMIKKNFNSLSQEGIIDRLQQSKCENKTYEDIWSYNNDPTQKKGQVHQRTMLQVRNNPSETKGKKMEVSARKEASERTDKELLENC